MGFRELFGTLWDGSRRNLEMPMCQAQFDVTQRAGRGLGPVRSLVSRRLSAAISYLRVRVGVHFAPRDTS